MTRNHFFNQLYAQGFAICPVVGPDEIVVMNEFVASKPGVGEIHVTVMPDGTPAAYMPVANINSPQILAAFVEAKEFIANMPPLRFAEIGQRVWRRSTTAQENESADPWRETEVNETYLALIQEAPEDYRYYFTVAPAPVELTLYQDPRTVVFDGSSEMATLYFGEKGKDWDFSVGEPSTVTLAGSLKTYAVGDFMPVYISEQEVLDFVNAMCEQSLDPVAFENWEKVKAQLCQNRQALYCQEGPLGVEEREHRYGDTTTDHETNQSLQNGGSGASAMEGTTA